MARTLIVGRCKALEAKHPGPAPRQLICGAAAHCAQADDDYIERLAHSVFLWNASALTSFSLPPSAGTGQSFVKLRMNGSMVLPILAVVHFWLAERKMN